ncbi:hypothetical protein A3A76_01140 [Candidatus Woesebacteria bacterium RIFCSPLOWO2_01_FULL_39_23]|uniref:Uncharacterized protein n=1 Tax=Candidatus Woesebacteria bacterium RIFCSPHIGHO2_01_FULL_40_22 TaxID=1802499 RepID=A0A1F7YEW2_9BACT|nr:MAG: hypothetical protein A2141_04710 [Candidatus Woesebacteria bacterium RBG_16_40_11]OGM25867.1 MAG: hypothetical protein A2628_04815 [Candidatus Woesebacteria bacterium RIFCSPHIGHO2_01_FULL_40_22]OGM36245.1 MAG: hypothetical protein A3E41_02545 [Candidatus Woesebacteria bacterium RIFCSPHIGHO2_12_FULL_38_9]OGM61621.1 MAG: hypothetical protein A3A76_01140 [Candidatus Woesebacteria bacterium RIFCSPLOWO2_01_FULL_39_23]
MQVEQNNVTPKEGSGNYSFLIVAILIIVIIALLFFYVLPYLRRTAQAPQINVPGKVNIDVNINTPNY